MATIQRAGSDSSSNTALGDVLGQVIRRLRLARLIHLGARGALIGVGLSLVAVGLAHWNLLPGWMPLALIVPVLILLGIGIGALFASMHPVDSMTAARLVESRLGLKERLSSALEFERSGQTPRDPEAALLLRLQQEDAAAHARGLQPAEAVPLHLPWEAKALLPAVILLLLALLLPALPIFVPPALRTERAVVQKSGVKLEKTARLIEKRADAQGLTATKRAAQDMQKLGQKMAQGRMDKKQAMVQMSQLSKQMADEQRRLAQANGGGAGQGNKSLAQAGQQLARSLQQNAATGQSPSGAAGKPQGGNATGKGGAGAKSGQQGAGKNGGAHGFNIPGLSGKKPGESGTSSQGQRGTPEVQKAAQAMQQDNTPGLSQQLRGLAQRTAAGQLSPADQHQAAQDLQKLSDALKGTPMSETQRHAQSAADAMKHGETQKAADEMRKAADAADREAQQQGDAQGMQDAQQSLQNGQQQMAQAGSPGDIHDDPGNSGNPPGQKGKPGQSGGNGQSSSGGNDPKLSQGNGTFNQMGQGNQSGNSAQGGSPGNLGDGSGKGAPNKPGPGHYSPESGTGQKTPSQNVGVWRGAAHPLDPKFDPTKNPGYGKVYLGAGDGSSGGRLGPLVKSQPGAKPPASAQGSSVPYYKSLAPARKSAESAMDKEDIPPSYRSSVRQYFDSLQPPAAKPSK